VAAFIGTTFSDPSGLIFHQSLATEGETTASSFSWLGDRTLESALKPIPDYQMPAIEVK
jgi:hypothetical protein